MKKILVLIISLMLCLLIPITVYGEDVSEPHEHSYKIISFDGNYGEAVLSCDECGDQFTDSFIDHLTTIDETGEKILDTYVDWFDVVNDGVINGKDYAYLIKNYTDFYDESSSDLIYILSDKQFYYKEIFFYCYFTVLLVFIAILLLISIRRALR